LGNSLSDNVEVFCRLQRQAYANVAGDPVAPHPCRKHHGCGADLVRLSVNNDFDPNGSSHGCGTLKFLEARVT
jgi:hypothetical protein